MPFYVKPDNDFSESINKYIHKGDLKCSVLYRLSVGYN